MYIKIKKGEREFEGDTELLPNNLSLRECEEIIVRGRLMQTRTGANYHYTLRIPDLEYYGRRYPYVHLSFRNATIETGEWHGSVPCYEDCSNCKLFCVGYGGTLINVPFLVRSETQPADLTFRKERAEIMREIKEKYIKCKITTAQGDIDVFLVDIWKIKDKIQQFLRSPNRPMIIRDREHEHYVYRLNGKVFRSQNNVLVVESDNNKPAICVTCPTHWWEPLQIDLVNWSGITRYDAILLSHV